MKPSNSRHIIRLLLNIMAWFWH